MLLLLLLFLLLLVLLHMCCILQLRKTLPVGVKCCICSWCYFLMLILTTFSMAGCGFVCVSVCVQIWARFWRLLQMMAMFACGGQQTSNV